MSLNVNLCLMGNSCGALCGMLWNSCRALEGRARDIMDVAPGVRQGEHGYGNRDSDAAEAV